MKGYPLHKEGFHPEGNIYEQLAYLYNQVGYPNSSDMNDLSEIVCDGIKYLNEYKVQ
ncbi:MAG: hypothetical protein ABIL27_03720 [candidate division WOR-3 bacterium]